MRPTGSLLHACRRPLALIAVILVALHGASKELSVPEQPTTPLITTNNVLPSSSENSKETISDLSKVLPTKDSLNLTKPRIANFLLVGAQKAGAFWCASCEACVGCVSSVLEWGVDVESHFVLTASSTLHICRNNGNSGLSFPSQRCLRSYSPSRYKLHEKRGTFL